MNGRDGSVVGVEKIADRGSGAERWDLVLLGEGYRADEIPKYRDDVRNLVDFLFATAPFDRLRDAINVHRVDVVSAESGAGDLCAGVRRNTFFNANFCTSGIDRLLVADAGTALDVATEAVAEMNATLMVVNSSTYGGSGGAVPVFSLAQGAFEIALHEMGHSHFGLADEYPYLRGCDEAGHARHAGPEPFEPNVTSNVNALKWSALLSSGVAVPTTTNQDCNDCDRQPNPAPTGTVGAFEGARYFRCGVFRPEYNCRMRELGVSFCAVCQNAIERVLSPFKPRRRRSVRS